MNVYLQKVEAGCKHGSNSIHALLIYTHQADVISTKTRGSFNQAQFWWHEDFAPDALCLWPSKLHRAMKTEQRRAAAPCI